MGTPCPRPVDHKINHHTVPGAGWLLVPSWALLEWVSLRTDSHWRPLQFAPGMLRGHQHCCPSPQGQHTTWDLRGWCRAAWSATTAGREFVLSARNPLCGYFFLAEVCDVTHITFISFFTLWTKLWALVFFPVTLSSFPQTPLFFNNSPPGRPLTPPPPPSALHMIRQIWVLNKHSSKF